MFSVKRERLLPTWRLRCCRAPKTNSVLLSDFKGRKRRRQHKYNAECSFSMATVVLPKERCTSEWGYSEIVEQAQWMNGVLAGHGQGLPTEMLKT
jgi:hypothetical protein